MNIPKRYKSHKTYTFCALSKVYSKREILTENHIHYIIMYMIFLWRKTDEKQQVFKERLHDWELCRGGGKSGGYDCVK
mgnify:FL=1